MLQSTLTGALTNHRGGGLCCLLHASRQVRSHAHIAEGATEGSTRGRILGTGHLPARLYPHMCP